ncbi:MAG: hypothetical protein PHF25_05030 [Candidatus Margulisbacteria bacterium]|nr:hypothetical protein [Candidatus Margulisiibacteriota bacterium]
MRCHYNQFKLTAEKPALVTPKDYPKILPNNGEPQGWGLGLFFSRQISDIFREGSQGGGGLYQSLGKFYIRIEGDRAVATDLTDYEFGKSVPIKMFSPTSGLWNPVTNRSEGGNPVNTFNTVHLDLGSANGIYSAGQGMLANSDSSNTHSPNNNL